jgi:hypothetical protein
MTFIILWIVSIVLCWVIAKHNERNTSTAVLLGVLFGFLAVIGYLIAGKSFEKKLKEANALGKASRGE